MEQQVAPPPRRFAPPQRFAPELPPAALARVLRHHVGDVRTLCAAACVARGWRDAARAPPLWRAPDLRDERLARKLDARRLRFLVSSGGTQVLDLTKTGSTTADVWVALSGAPPLDALHVRGLRGLRVGEWPDDAPDGRHHRHPKDARAHARRPGRRRRLQRG